MKKNNIDLSIFSTVLGAEFTGGGAILATLGFMADDSPVKKPAIAVGLTMTAIGFAIAVNGASNTRDIVRKCNEKYTAEKNVYSAFSE